MNRLFRYLACIICLVICSVTAKAQSANTKTRGVDKEYEALVKKYKKLGYIVYSGDTLRGYLLFDEHSLKYQSIKDSSTNDFTVYKYNDLNLTAAVTNNKVGSWLYWIRVEPTSKRMYRLIHSGKLTVYDDKLEFINNPKDISTSYLVIKYNNTVDKLTNILTNRQEFVDYVNQVYHTKWVPQNMEWTDMWMQLDGMD